MFKELLQKIHHWTIPHSGNDYKPHIIRHHSLFFYSALIVLVKISALLALILVYPSQAEFSTITSNRIMQLTNQQRVSFNLSELKTSEILNQAAALKMADMFDHNYFAHTSPDGVKPWEWFNQAGYNYTYAGENLAMNFIQAEDTVEAWMDSPSHRENLLSANYDEIGVAVGVGQIDGQQTTVVVQLFGKRYVRVAGEETFSPSAREIEVNQPDDIANPISAEASLSVNKEEITTVPLTQNAQQQVELKKSGTIGWLAKLIRYSSNFFFILLIFVAINLLLTIFIRLEIQHKPIILHCLFVILLATVMILWKVHFMEGMDQIKIL